MSIMPPSGPSEKPQFMKLAYLGPVPERPRDYYRLVRPSRERRFVYLLMDEFGDYVYVGRSHNPGTRFDKHRRREWWQYVDRLKIFEVSAFEHFNVDRVVAHVEREAIKNLDPAFNIVGVAR